MLALYSTNLPGVLTELQHHFCQVWDAEVQNKSSRSNPHSYNRDKVQSLEQLIWVQDAQPPKHALVVHQTYQNLEEKDRLVC